MSVRVLRLSLRGRAGVEGADDGVRRWLRVRLEALVGGALRAELWYGRLILRRWRLLRVCLEVRLRKAGHRRDRSFSFLRRGLQRRLLPSRS